jgi:hypothetical protein
LGRSLVPLVRPSAVTSVPQLNPAYAIAVFDQIHQGASLAYLGARGTGCIDEQSVEDRATRTDHHVDALVRRKLPFHDRSSTLEAHVRGGRRARV